jgi:hypothetical protein
MAASLHAMPGSGSSRSISALRLQVPPLRRSASFGGIDIALICLFMAGIYTNCTIQLSAKVPFPSVPAGVAGLLLLWRWRDRVSTASFACFIGVLLLYVISVLCATDVSFLGRRTNGLIQLT